MVDMTTNQGMHFACRKVAEKQVLQRENSTEEGGKNEGDQPQWQNRSRSGESKPAARAVQVGT
jgi:hypothetical protein